MSLHAKMFLQTAWLTGVLTISLFHDAKPSGAQIAKCNVLIGKHYAE